jgi:3-deoxy-7-phosphoheptulonate synthase
LRIVSDGTEKKIVKVGNVEIGGEQPVIIGGPCAVESEEQIREIAFFIKEHGASILRGGAYKPRTSPYSFQGLGVDGLRYLKSAGREADIPVISEMLDLRDIDVIYEYVDIIQIGSRNMQNFSLLKEVGKLDKPVMLKRGMAATIDEWLNAAEYIASEGNDSIILCERGIRTYERYTRNTLDIAAVPIIKNISRLPIIVDPSHGTGRRELISPMALSSVAAGADGIMVEVHHYPEIALSDGSQSINLDEFSSLSQKVSTLYKCMKDNSI